MKNIQMVDLKSQYENIKSEIDQGIQEVIDQTAFINGPQVKTFAMSLSNYLDASYVVPCANGTDALQIALMSLDLEPGDEIIVPAFTYVATAEVIGLLKLKPVLTEVDPDNFMITATEIKKVITPKSKAIVPVHLYGQCAPMEEILKLAKELNLYVIEDTAQAIGAVYTFSDGRTAQAGTMGDIGCTSFFPSKNLGCYGDGGAMFTNDATLGKKLQVIANHGQAKKYYHSVIGCNSRLDTIQAAVLNVKLKYLDKYSEARNRVADTYDRAFRDISWIKIPVRVANSTHVFHQYTLQLVNQSDRDQLKIHLQERGVPSMVYYPVSLHLQEAFKTSEFGEGDFPICEDLCTRVLSLPIHTEMDTETLSYIIESVKSFKS
ncbi:MULTISPECIES: DegT/DnrJ/EryC1/StrS aminotransferase family protein [unclassified Sphingobacterium]|uniref:DegT/DnrJ/EryC1/StrS family aminotransferase n=1 Tax=unclassified Sphingobacterium TaxID=2609468 RepID=UPI0010445990|nr:MULTISPECIES: DegT/DnrJ/EryC1/StrS family aminotransferase [unclassified Sphingobacterium]MCS3555817.1 dTDP-4-amino-4,6-dideoxygalactose transaminase [Sphingobacterium sp. JUb21]